MTTTFSATFVPVAFTRKNSWRKCFSASNYSQQKKTHLQYEPSKEPARDGEKVRDSEAEDETGKLTVSKSVGRDN